MTTALFDWRKTCTKDLAECLQLHPAKIGSELVGLSRAMRAWQQLLEMPHATRSALVEMHVAGRVEIVGFGIATFVKKSFAESEVQNPQPDLNARIIASIAEGKPVVATYPEIREANTRGDLEQVILDISWKVGPLTPAQVDQVRILLGQAYFQLHAGYRFSRILYELADERDFWHVKQQRDIRILPAFENLRGQHRTLNGVPIARSLMSRRRRLETMFTALYRGSFRITCRRNSDLLAASRNCWN